MTFKILTADDISSKMNSYWVGANYDTNNPCSINAEMLKLNEGNAGYNSFNAPFSTKYLNLQPIRNLYLHISNIIYSMRADPRGCRPCSTDGPGFV